jgi:hypothetical protein
MLFGCCLDVVRMLSGCCLYVVRMFTCVVFAVLVYVGSWTPRRAATSRPEQPTMSQTFVGALSILRAVTSCMVEMMYYHGTSGGTISLSTCAESTALDVDGTMWSASACKYVYTLKTERCTSPCFAIRITNHTLFELTTYVHRQTHLTPYLHFWHPLLYNHSHATTMCPEPVQRSTKHQPVHQRPQNTR